MRWPPMSQFGWLVCSDNWRSTLSSTQGNIGWQVTEFNNNWLGHVVLSHGGNWIILMRGFTLWCKIVYPQFASFWRDEPMESCPKTKYVLQCTSGCTMCPHTCTWRIIIHMLCCSPATLLYHTLHITQKVRNTRLFCCNLKFHAEQSSDNWSEDCSAWNFKLQQYKRGVSNLLSSFCSALRA